MAWRPSYVGFTLAVLFVHCALVAADGLGCNTWQVGLKEDMGFIFQEDLALTQFLTGNLSKYCTSYVPLWKIPKSVYELPTAALQPSTYTWDCAVRDSTINKQLSSLFPMTIHARGCGQARDKHFEGNPPPNAACSAVLASSDNVHSLKITLYGERHLIPGYVNTHAWVWFCDLQASVSPVPLDEGDTLKITYIINHATQNSLSVAMLLACALVAAFLH